ncbi:unnamed protein product [Gadus morhua 'NCC']
MVAFLRYNVILIIILLPPTTAVSEWFQLCRSQAQQPPCWIVEVDVSLVLGSLIVCKKELDSHPESFGPDCSYIPCYSPRWSPQGSGAVDACGIAP